VTTVDQKRYIFMRKLLILSGLAALVFASLTLASVPAMAGQETKAAPSQKNVIAPDTAGANKATADTGGPAPIVFIPDSTFDFGTVAQNQPITHVFKVYNKGAGPLKLIQARAT